MTEVIMMRGLPASGKTTLAKIYVSDGYVRVNKDDLRTMMHGSEWSKRNEASVLFLRDQIIKDALIGGRSVVVDDTNFAPIHEETLRKIAKEFGAKFIIRDMIMSPEACILRNKNRVNPVPEKVIWDMYNTYIKEPNKKVEYDEKLSEAIIVDIDGTLAHIGGDNPRNPYDASRAMEDSLDDAVSNIVAMAYNNDYKIIILTGRDSKNLQITKDWLDENGVNYDFIWSRDEGDVRKDTIVKQELYAKHIEGKFNIKYVIDDRPSVCRMWRSIGLKVLQVGDPHVEF